MANEVYANGREVSCKAGSGKSICAFPDVCFTPPLTPATPPGVPIPYPNTGMTTDTSGGSKTVKISGKEVMLKDSSYFSTSTGDEAGCAPKKGVITSKIKGKVYFTSWSMDVKIEGENAVRHLDLTTHNHASLIGQTPPWPFADAMAVGTGDPCEAEKLAEQEACKNFKPNKKRGKDACKEAGLGKSIPKSDYGAVRRGYKSRADWSADMAKKAAASNPAAKCIQARRCKLVPYEANKKEKKAGHTCCPSQTGDHLIPKTSFFDGPHKNGNKFPEWEDYSEGRAPVMCAEGPSQYMGSHALRHAHHTAYGPAADKKHPFDEANKLAAQGAKEVFKAEGCTQGCIEAQLKKGHEDMGDTDADDVKHSPSGDDLSKAEIKRRVKTRKPRRRR